KISKESNIIFVHGKGKKKSIVQKSIEQLNNYIDRLKKYTKDLHIMGERNSYSKTDNDATFMRMKEDHMKNGQLKPAYNIQ
ncbi:IS5/IS1182 family transposase, partial [Clostridioides sp. ZZV14-6345]|nr:IS5/IS1182 family transposase [Clostridioides sp. ZZV14-6345]